jgi:hypothetical protein
LLVVLKAPLFSLLAPSAKLKFLGAKSLLKAPKWRLSAKYGITVGETTDHSTFGTDTERLLIPG